MSFRYWLENFIKSLPYNVYYGLKNLIIWLPIIWKDRSWDSFYIYKIFHFKLSLVEKHIRKYDRHTTAIRDADNIKVCLILLDRLIKDEYEEKAFKKVDEKWGELIMNLDGDRKVNIYRPNVKTDGDIEQERKESKECYKTAYEMRNQDKQFLFDHLRKHIDEWWD